MTPQSSVDLAQRLAEAEATITALLDGQIDAVVDARSMTPVLLSKAQEALRQSEERYRRIVETTREGVWMLDASRTTTFTNRRMREMLNWEPTPGRECSPFEFLDDDNRRRLEAYLQQPDRGQIDIRYTRRDGTSVWTLLEAAPIMSKAGAYEGSMAMVVDITGRKQAEIAVSHERDRAESYLDTAQVIMLAVDLSGAITMINRYGCSVVGWTAAELLGRNWMDTCVPARLRPAVKATLRELFAIEPGTAATIVENAIVTKSGAERLIEWRNSELRDDAGAVIGAITSGTDITDRARAVEEIRQRAQLAELGAAVGVSLAEGGSLTEALQRCAEALVTHVGAAFARVWTLNQHENVLELQASAGLYTHLNGPHGKVPVGQFKIGRIARDRKPHLTNTVVGDPEVSEQEWAQREGMVAFAGHPLIVGDRVVGVMALFAQHALSDSAMSALASVADHIALGIERHRNSDALRIAEERMRFALESAEVGIWDLDYKTGMLSWSPTLERQYGLAPGTFDGTFEAFVALIHPDDREAALAIVTRAMTGGTDFAVSNRVIWPDGNVRSLSGFGRIHLDAQGQPLRGIGISLDVTERRALESRYQQAQKMDAIGQLASGVAHDFNNLLTVILGFTEFVLEDKTITERHGSDLGEIIKAARRASELTKQLLAFSRQQVLEMVPLDLNKVINEMTAMARRLIGEHIDIHLDLAPQLPLALSDRGQLEQVVMNLLVNARDAMSEGGKITISTTHRQFENDWSRHEPVVDGHYVLLSITDTGGGMTKETQRRLFEPFYTTKAAGKGTGLGLSTAYGIVKQSKGYIFADTEIGRGTTFTVYLPCTDGAALGAGAGGPAVACATPIVSETILLVEDESAVREFSRRNLERDGYRVFVADNGNEAERVFSARAGEIDLVLTDVVMPGCGGPELLTRLRRHRPEMRVLYMSGYTEQSAANDLAFRGAPTLLQKPFSAADLRRRVREVLDAPAVIPTAS